MIKVLIAGSAFRSELHLAYFRSIGVEAICCEREDGVLPDAAYEADAVICNWLFKHHRIEQFSNLKFIQLLSAGMDRVPLDYISAHGIVLCNARGVYSIPMAEFAVSGVLQLIKHSAVFSEQKKECIWNKLRNLTELSGKNVLIVGAGSIGSETAKRFSAFTDEVYGVDAFVPEHYKWFKEIFDISKLDEGLFKADVVVLTLPLTDETRHLFDKTRFSAMKQDAIFVNIARGGIADETALIEALNGHLAGAVLDVFEQEPLPPDSPFWKLDNVILTPHNSFVSDQNDKRLWTLCQKNLEEYLKKSEDDK